MILSASIAVAVTLLAAGSSSAQGHGRAGGDGPPADRGDRGGPMPSGGGGLLSGVSQLIKTGSEVVRDFVPNVDFNGPNGPVVNLNVGGVVTGRLDTGTGRVAVVPGAVVTFAENLPGLPMLQALYTARAALRNVYPLPAEVADELIRAGMSEHIVRKTRWSPDWYVTNYLPFTGGRPALTIDNIVVINDPAVLYSTSRMAHELTHVAQYERLGIQQFATQYSLNNWIFEGEANDVEAQVLKRVLDDIKEEWLVNGEIYTQHADGTVTSAPAFITRQ
jgi:hypothetical protein